MNYVKELILPFCVLLVLGTVLLPVPAAFLDFLLVTNVLLALLLLLTAFYVANPLKLSALPGILLLVTMYRLALNVSTTRRILSGGDPGQMIDAFGTIVVQGNIIVGLVIFLVITLVQFIVIAKGSERVAEVAARFTLDALPGKQMSIDADMRSGILGVTEARIKRQEIQTESRFYGALDGAMKFVKGDAIAGLVITAINLLGGIVIGMTMFDLEVVESIARFSLYTIGDGLLSQIPALLNSLAAGMIVTRVTHGDAQTSLSEDLLRQVGQFPAIKMLLAGLALLISLLPSMPWLPFFGLSLLLVASCFLAKSTQSEMTTEDSEETFSARMPVLIELHVRSEQVLLLKEPKQLADTIERCRQDLFDRRGILLPPLEIRILDSLDSRFAFLLRGVRHRCSSDSNDDSELLSGIASAFEQLVQGRTSELVDDIMTRRLLDYYEDIAPEQVGFVVPDIASVTTVTFVLRALVCEGISIRSLDVIMQAIAEFGMQTHATAPANERLLVTHVRIAMARYICEHYGLYEAKQTIHQLDAALDAAIVGLEQSQKPLPSESIELLLEDVATLPEGSLIVSSKYSRAFVRECCRAKQLNVHCLAIEELTDDAQWQLTSVVGSAVFHAVEDEQFQNEFVV